MDPSGVSFVDCCMWIEVYKVKIIKRAEYFV